MEVFFDFATVPVITILVYWIIELLKQLTKENENFMRFIPITATFLGIILGLIIFFTMPEMSIANNVLFAIVAGGISGLASTGGDQLLRQLQKYKTDEVNKVSKK